MKPQVIRLSMLKLETEVLTKIVSSVLNRSITQSIDNANKTLGDLSSYIGLLGEMQIPGSKFSEIMEHPGKLLSHIFLSYVIIATEESFVSIALNAGLSATIISYAPAQALGVVSGTLEQWRTATINCCIPRAEKEIREIFNLLF